jgi:hypothetical protein
MSPFEALMKTLGKTTIVVTLCLLSLATQLTGLKICYGSDGHIELELASDSCHDTSDDTHSECDDSQTSGYSSMHTYQTCIDIPLSMNTETSHDQENRVISPSLSITCVLPYDTYRNILSRAQRLSLLVDTDLLRDPLSLTHLRTVALLV